MAISTVLAVISIVLAVISIGLAIYQALQKPPKPPVPTPEEVERIPTADQGTPIPVVFGFRSVSHANVVWWGDVFYKENKIKP